MKKQYVFVGLVPRLFATTIDLFILAITVTQYVTTPLFLRSVRNYFHNSIEMQSFKDLRNLSDTQLYQFLYSSEHMRYLVMIFLIQAGIFAIYFIGFWVFCDSSPGKFILGMRIVDNDSFKKPTIFQYIKRFLGYALGIFSIILIPFAKRHRAIHDKIAHTVVVKR